jgi:hypothetical protein
MPVGDKEHQTVRAAIASVLIFCGAPVLADDMGAVRQQSIKLIHAQTECFKIESFSKSIRKVDLETAAYAVVGRYADQSQRFKSYSAAHSSMNPFQFEAYWVGEERKDIEVVKRFIAVARTP